MRHIAMEGRCFVLSACQYTRRDDYPDDYRLPARQRAGDGADPRRHLIVGPLGDFSPARIRWRDHPRRRIDLDEIARGKFDLDVVGHYARPDVFRLEVDTAEKPAVRAAG